MKSFIATASLYAVGFAQQAPQPQPQPNPLVAQIGAIQGSLGQIVQHAEDLDAEMLEMQTYIGEIGEGHSLKGDIKHQARKTVKAAAPKVADLALKKMARQMFKSFGEPKQFVRKAFKSVPTTLYQGPNCHGLATAMPPRAKQFNEWTPEELQARNMDNAARSVMVPPGYKLEMFENALDEGEAYVVYGKMRKDREGPVCHLIDAEVADAGISAVRLSKDMRHKK